MQEVSANDMEELGRMLSDGTLRAQLGHQLVGIDKLPDALAGHSATIGQGHTVGKTVVTIDADTVQVDLAEQDRAGARAAGRALRAFGM